MEFEEGLQMLKEGERAPEFTLPDDTGRDRSLTDFLTSGATVLYFYPADFTPGCTRQACALRDLQSALIDAKLQVVGVSPQSPASHARFRAKHQLPFTLLSDQDKEVIKMYGVNGPLGIGVRRATYLIDGSRRIRDSVIADILIGRHEDFVRRAILLRATNNGAAV
jgi:peroxiredoxin Q/BCP